MERLGELLIALVVQPGVAAGTLPHEHVALTIGQHRSTEGPGLERHHRQAFVVRRHDQQIRGCDRIELFLITDESEVADLGVLWDGHDRLADEYQCERGIHPRVVPKVLEQLSAALVLIDPSYVDDRWTLDACRPSKSVRLRVGWHVRADTDDDPGNRVVAGDGVDECPLLVRVVHERPDATEAAPKDVQPERRVPFGGRDQQSAPVSHPETVVRVVVPEAEEDAVVVVGAMAA